MAISVDEPSGWPKSRDDSLYRFARRLREEDAPAFLELSWWVEGMIGVEVVLTSGRVLRLPTAAPSEGLLELVLLLEGAWRSSRAARACSWRETPWTFARRAISPSDLEWNDLYLSSIVPKTRS